MTKAVCKWCVNRKYRETPAQTKPFMSYYTDVCDCFTYIEKVSHVDSVDGCIKYKNKHYKRCRDINKNGDCKYYRPKWWRRLLGLDKVERCEDHVSR